MELAKERVRLRVSEGGHNIPEDVIERRYYRGLKNLFELYLPLCDNAIVMDNSMGSEVAVLGKLGEDVAIFNPDIFDRMKRQVYG